uniref:Transposase n=1 Tax=Ascaris lumbricoides TaxID=6252 RepID=A0A0M3HIJ0_ASCLU
MRKLPMNTMLWCNRGDTTSKRGRRDEPIRTLKYADLCQVSLRTGYLE